MQHFFSKLIPQKIKHNNLPIHENGKLRNLHIFTICHLIIVNILCAMTTFINVFLNLKES